MSLAKWKCVNLGNCAKADTQKIFELAAGEHEPTCEECGGALLRIGRKPSGFPKLLLLGAVAVLVVAGIVFALSGGKGAGGRKDDGGGSGGKPITQMPLITSAAIVVGQVARPLEHTVQVNDPQATVEVAGLPAWLRFDSTARLLAGTPPASGKTVLTVTARNAVGSDKQLLQVSVAPGSAGTQPGPGPFETVRPTTLQRKVLVPVRAADTNLTLELVTDQIVQTVKVRVNSGVEQALQNRDVEATTITLNLASTPEDLYEVITQINDDPPRVHRFAAYGKRRMQVWIEGVNSTVVAAERVGIALLAQEGSRIQNDPAVLNAFNFWTNKYVQELRLLPILDDAQSQNQAYEQLNERYTKQNRSQLLTLMLPMIGRHVSELRTKGTIPGNFVDEILQTYKSHPNLLKEPKAP